MDAVPAGTCTTPAIRKGTFRGALADGERVMGFEHRVYSYVPVGVRLLDTPAVVGDLAARGIDTTDRFLWELLFITDSECVTVRDAAVRALAVEP